MRMDVVTFILRHVCDLKVNTHSANRIKIAKKYKLDHTFLFIFMNEKNF